VFEIILFPKKSVEGG